MARLEIPMFVWFPQDRTNQNWGLTINGIDVRDRVIKGKLSWGLIGEDLSCEITLENSDGSLLNTFNENDIIIFKFDLSGGNTKQWEGEIEFTPTSYEGNYTLKIIGSHYTTRATDVNANKEYINSKISDIRKDLISTYLSGFTSNNVVDNNKQISIKFVDKPLIDCFIDLNIQGDDDCFVGHDKDFNSFINSSKNNDTQALVIFDNIFSIKGLGIDNTIKRNKVTVYGEAGGLPVVHIASSTQSRTREMVITDNSATDESIAKSLSDAELDKQSNPDTEGSADGMFIPDLTPGYMTYIVSPDQDITNRYRLTKFTWNIPDETMEIQVSQTRTIAKLFKDRIIKDISQEQIINPFSMFRSYVITFDDTSKIISNDDFVIENGIIRKSTSISQVSIISQTKISDINAVNMSLEVIGSVLDGATFHFVADGSENYQSIYPRTDTSVTNTGKNIRLKIIITDNNTRIDTVGLYWR